MAVIVLGFPEYIGNKENAGRRENAHWTPQDAATPMFSDLLCFKEKGGRKRGTVS